jgi:hypothetical protein
MSEFPECLQIVIAEVDAAVEADWNRWYDTVHLPDAGRQRPGGKSSEALRRPFGRLPRASYFRPPWDF